MKTIVYIGAFELPDKDAAAHRVMNNAKILKELGYNVVFIDVNRGNKVEQSKMDKFKKNIEFECYTRKYPKSIVDWVSYIACISKIKQVVCKYKNVNAIICYNYPSIALLNLMMYCKKNKIKIISDCTEWYEDRRIIKRFDTNLRMKYIHKKLDGIICISSYLQKYYKKYTQTIQIPPLIDINEDKWKCKYNKNNDSNIKLVYSGNPGKHKDKLNYIIEKLNNINKNNYIFNIIGIDREQYLVYYPEHKNIIKKMENNIKFLGKVTHQKSIELIKEADFLIFIRENKRVNNAGFPTKFVESITCGTPVITTNTSDLSNYLEEGKNGFFINVNDKTNKGICLNDILELDREKIKYMKMYCKSLNTFHYKNKLNDMEIFLSKL